MSYSPKVVTSALAAIGSLTATTLQNNAFNKLCSALAEITEGPSKVINTGADFVTNPFYGKRDETIINRQTKDYVSKATDETSYEDEGIKSTKNDIPPEDRKSQQCDSDQEPASKSGCFSEKHSPTNSDDSVETLEGNTKMTNDDMNALVEMIVKECQGAISSQIEAVTMSFSEQIGALRKENDSLRSQIDASKLELSSILNTHYDAISELSDHISTLQEQDTKNKILIKAQQEQLSKLDNFAKDATKYLVDLQSNEIPQLKELFDKMNADLAAYNDHINSTVTQLMDEVYGTNDEDDSIVVTHDPDLPQDMEEDYQQPPLVSSSDDNDEDDDSDDKLSWKKTFAQKVQDAFGEKVVAAYPRRPSTPVQSINSTLEQQQVLKNNLFNKENGGVVVQQMPKLKVAQSNLNIEHPMFNSGMIYHDLINTVMEDNSLRFKLGEIFILSRQDGTQLPLMYENLNLEQKAFVCDYGRKNYGHTSDTASRSSYNSAVFRLKELIKSAA